MEQPQAPKVKRIMWENILFLLMFFFGLITMLMVVLTYLKVNAIKLPSTVSVPVVTEKVVTIPAVTASPSAKLKVKATIAPSPTAE